VPALTALREWVRVAVRTPNGPLASNRVAGGPSRAQVARGRTLFNQSGCQACHGGGKWTVSTKDFVSPPAAGEIATEANPKFGNPVQAQYLSRFLRDIGSFNLGVAGGTNPIGANVGAAEKAAAGFAAGRSAAPQDALGTDYNGDGKGTGFNVPSLLGIHAVPPYYHNGACETLACVAQNVRHRTANGTQPDRLGSARNQAALVAFLESIGAATPRP